MPRSSRKETKHVSFRMAADAYLDYVTIAESRGVDLSAILNWVLNDYRPVVLRQKAEHDAAMQMAIAPATQPRSVQS